MPRSWGHEVFVAVDQVANAILAGYADETISARSYRLGRVDEHHERWGRWRVAWVIVDALFYWQDIITRLKYGAWPEKKHCERAYLQEVHRMQLPPEYRV